jgi:hypothetical protein
MPYFDKLVRMIMSNTLAYPANNHQLLIGDNFAMTVLALIAEASDKYARVFPFGKPLNISPGAYP